MLKIVVVAEFTRRIAQLNDPFNTVPSKLGNYSSFCDSLIVSILLYDGSLGGIVEQL